MSLFGLNAFRYTNTGYHIFTKSYLTAVEAAGRTPTSGEEEAIDTFVRGIVTQGFWNKLDRIHLFLWGDEDANAIDLKTLGSGTWEGAGSITHGSKYAQGDGTTNYFDLGVSPSSLSISVSSYYLGSHIISLGGGARRAIGARNGDSQILLLGTGDGPPKLELRGMQNASERLLPSVTSSLRAGIISGGRNNGTQYINRRSGASVTNVDSQAEASPSGTVPSVNLFAMCYNNNGTPTQFQSQQIGAVWVGSDMDSDDDEAFTELYQDLYSSF